MAAAERLTGDLRTGLITILRAGVPPTDREEAVIGRAMEILDSRHDGVPVLHDLLQVVKDAPEDVRAAALDRGDIARYRDLTEGLEATLTSLAEGTSKFGTIFSR